uniref:Uncharacterized protein n=1 Tax=Chenopodium quinoa TaxID=63459 RepID=A0A803LFK4_CHEQI
KYMHHNKIMSFTPFMSLKPSAHKVLEVTNVPKITCYHDTWLDLMAINHLSQNLQAVAGIQIEEKGYDGLLETCKEVTVKFDSVQQRQLSLEGLARSIPKEIFPLANFEDMSCDMIFGEEPPTPDEDPATKQPCYKLCKINKRHTTERCS